MLPSVVGNGVAEEGVVVVDTWLVVLPPIEEYFVRPVGMRKLGEADLGSGRSGASEEVEEVEAGVEDDGECAVLGSEGGGVADGVFGEGDGEVEEREGRGGAGEEAAARTKGVVGDKGCMDTDLMRALLLLEE